MKLKYSSTIVAYALIFTFPLSLQSSLPETQPLLPKKIGTEKRRCPSITVGGLMAAAFFCFGVIRILPIPHSNLVIAPCNDCLSVDPKNVCGAVNSSDSRIRAVCPNAIITRADTSYSIFASCETFDSAMRRVTEVCPASTTFAQSPLANKFKKKRN